MKIHKIFLAAVLAISSLSLAACAKNESKPENGDKPRVLRVANMTGQPDQYADYIGIEQGIFKKYNIDVQTTEFVAGINTIDSVVTGTADTGLLADFAAANRFGNTLHATNLIIFSDLSAGVSNNGGLYVAPEYADNLKALDESVNYINAHLDESAEKIAAKFGINADDFKSNWTQLTIKFGLSEESAAHLSDIKDWAFANGIFPEDYNIRQFYYTKAAQAAFPDEVTVDLSSVNS